MHKIVDGKKIEMTADEITARQEEEKQNITRQEELKILDENKKTKKTSGKAKLKAGEALTDAEIAALFGA